MMTLKMMMKNLIMMILKMMTALLFSAIENDLKPKILGILLKISENCKDLLKFL